MHDLNYSATGENQINFNSNWENNLRNTGSRWVAISSVFFFLLFSTTSWLYCQYHPCYVHKTALSNSLCISLVRTMYHWKNVFPRIATFSNKHRSWCFPVHYNRNLFKSRVNPYLSSKTSQSSFPNPSSYIHITFRSVRIYALALYGMNIKKKEFELIYRMLKKEGVLRVYS